MQGIELSPVQRNALEGMKEYIRRPFHTHFVLDGHAGVGKTTILRELAAWISTLPVHHVAWLAPTGKAAHVLGGSVGSSVNRLYDYIGTIHSFIYDKPMKLADSSIIFHLKQSLPCDLVVIDEASMVNEALYRDLLDFRVPTIFVGDSFQLPPVNTKRAVGGAEFSVLTNPDVHIEEVHRQSANSPILQLATRLRNEETPTPYMEKTEEGTVVLFDNRKHKTLVDKYLRTLASRHDKEDSVILSYTNRLKSNLNQFVRREAGFGTRLPQPGEKILCCRNDRGFGIVNGDLFRVLETDSNCGIPGCVRIRYMDPESCIEFESIALAEGFGCSGQRTVLEGKLEGALKSRASKQILARYEQGTIHDFDYGYCETVHKAQGSEWNNVMLYNDHPKDNEYFRWWYTAVTRSQKVFMAVL